MAYSHYRDCSKGIFSKEGVVGDGEVPKLLAEVAAQGLPKVASKVS
jgi:hypothetical protein